MLDIVDASKTDADAVAHPHIRQRPQAYAREGADPLPVVRPWWAMRSTIVRVLPVRPWIQPGR